MRNLPEKVRRELEAKEAAERARNKPKPTNADRIRAMSDEKLAGFLGEPHCDKISHERCRSYCLVCNQCRLDWLQQPASEEGEQE